MKIGDIELAGISRYRSELMGLAIVFVMLFHVYLPRTDMFFGLRRIGNIGVDIFFFVSGMGLWFSWIKNFSAPSNSSSLTHQLKKFYLRRFTRIYPTWLFVASIFYISAYINGEGRSTSTIDLIGDITINWDFWLHDELTFWYIPATMALYLVAPFYMELIRRHPIYRWLPVAMIAWCIIVQWVGPVHKAVGHLEIFWSRVPIFFIGINMGEAIRRKNTIEGSGLWLILLLFLMTLSACVYIEQIRLGRHPVSVESMRHFPLFIERMLYIPLTVTSLLLLARLLTHVPQRILAALRFVGTLSLEIYLLHMQFILTPLEHLHLGYWLTFLACLAITLPIAWLTSKLISILVTPIEKHIK